MGKIACVLNYLQPRTGVFLSMEPKTEPPPDSYGGVTAFERECDRIYELIGGDPRVLLVPVDEFVAAGGETIELHGAAERWAIRYDRSLSPQGKRVVLRREYRRLLMRTTPAYGIQVLRPL